MMLTVILISFAALELLIIGALLTILPRFHTKFDGNIVVTTKNGITTFSLEVGDPYSLSDKKEMHFKVITRPSSTIELDRD